MPIFYPQLVLNFSIVQNLKQFKLYWNRIPIRKRIVIQTLPCVSFTATSNNVDDTQYFLLDSTTGLITMGSPAAPIGQYSLRAEATVDGQTIGTDVSSIILHFHNKEEYSAL